MKGLTDKELDLIDAYVRKELSEDERRSVNERLSQSEEWQEEYKLRCLAAAMGKRSFEDGMRARFREIDRAESTGRRRTWSAVLAVAASVIVLVVAYVLLGQNGFEKRAMAGFKDFPNVAYPIEKSATEVNDRVAAYQAFELKDYAMAVDRFTGLTDRDTRDDLYLGLSQLGLENFSGAQASLERVVESSDPRWSQVADWYLIRVELGLDEIDDATQRATRISLDDTHRYQKEALALL